MSKSFSTKVLSELPEPDRQNSRVFYANETSQEVKMLMGRIKRRVEMTHKEKALALFEQKFHCSQAVLAAFAEECGLTEKQALKLGSCFGGGMRKGEVCGACTGALMVLGLLYGQDDKEDTASRETADAVNDMMMDGFAAVSGSYLCKELLKCDISTEEGAEYAREHALFTEFCPQMVANAVEVLEQIMGQQM